MRHNVSELEGGLLDAAVALAEGLTLKTNGADRWAEDDEDRLIGYTYGDATPAFSPSRLWAQGGPIIERERIDLQAPRGGSWVASTRIAYAVGDAPLIAAMRAFVASKLGNEVELPDAPSPTAQPHTSAPRA